MTSSNLLLAKISVNKMSKALSESPALKRGEIIEFLFANFELSDVEKLEVRAIEKQLRNGYTSFLEDLSKTTKNAGVQYLFFYESLLVQRLIPMNKNLDPMVVLFFLENLSAVAVSVTRNVIRLIIDFLIMNEVIVADVTLFKRAWAVSEVHKREINMETLAHNRRLYIALKTRSRAETGNVNAMSVETLLFILAKFSERDDSAIPALLRNLINEILENRREEIRVWVEKHMPDCIDLPLSWSYKLFDLYV